MLSNEGELEASVDEAWIEVEQRWDDDIAHKRFVAVCAATGALAEAGARYRAVMERDPARSERAKKQISAVMGAALLTLHATREPVKVRSYRLGWVLCGAFLVICGYAILSVLRRVGR